MSKSYTKWLVGGFCLLNLFGCGNRHSSVATTPAPRIVQSPPPATLPASPPTMMVMGPSVHTFQSTPPAIQFDYPADWVPDKAQTACFAVCAPKGATPSYSSLSLDIPTLPWHLPGMITCSMVASGYASDLKKNQIHDAVLKEQSPITVAGCTGKRITSQGHENGAPSIDIAVILVHSDHVYILSADSDQAGYDTAKKTLEAACASWKWCK